MYSSTKMFIFCQFLFLQKRYDLPSVFLLNNKQLRPASRKSIRKLIQIENLKTVSLFSLGHNRVQRLWAIRVSIRTYERCYRFEAILASGDEIKLNMNIFKLEISQGKQINIWINRNKWNSKTNKQSKTHCWVLNERHL